MAKRKLNLNKPANIENKTARPNPVPDQHPKVWRTRFCPKWNPNNFKPVLGLVDLNQWLLENLPGSGPYNMVEVGSQGGESTIIFNTFKHWDVISCVDIWPWYPPRRAFQDRLKDQLASGRVLENQMDSVAAATDQNFATVCPFGAPDFVYVDADHSYGKVLADLEAWEPRLAPGGFLGGHDYSPHWGEVRAAVDEFAAAREYDIVTFQDGSFVLTPKVVV